MRKLLFPILGICALLTSCAKEAGEGGNSTIHGYVYGYDINSSGIVTDSGDAAGQKVYISYGDNTTIDDDVETSYTGEYEFRGLRKGTYTIFAYSQCDTCIFNQKVQTIKVEITDNKQEVIAPDLVIYD